MKCRCYVCGLVYCHRQSLNRHLKTYHQNTVTLKEVKKCDRKCSICSFTSATTPEILKHFKQVHAIEITCETMTFDSLKEFKAWKTEYEEKNTVRFNLLTGSDAHIKPNTVLYYICHRSGYFQTSGKGIRHLKAQGSKKIDGYCPSHIRLSLTHEGKFAVKFTPEHVGHANELAHVTLRAKDRTAIASKIASKVPFNAILQELADDTSISDNKKRVHLLTKRDLYNIENSFNLKSQSVRRLPTSKYMRRSSKCEPESTCRSVDAMEVEPMYVYEITTHSNNCLNDTTNAGPVKDSNNWIECKLATYSNDAVSDELVTESCDLIGCEVIIDSSETLDIESTTAVTRHSDGSLNDVTTQLNNLIECGVIVDSSGAMNVEPTMQLHSNSVECQVVAHSNDLNKVELTTVNCEPTTNADQKFASRKNLLLSHLDKIIELIKNTDSLEVLEVFEKMLQPIQPREESTA